VTEPTPPRSGRTNSAIAVCVTTLLLAAPLLLPEVLPGLKPGSAGIPLCMSKRLFNISCPGCGLTRSVCACARLDIVQSARLHLFGPLFLALFAALWVLGLAGLIAGRSFLPDPNSKWTSIAAMGFMIALLGYWGLRTLLGTLPP
jgi:hypothetical protein